MKPVSLNTQKTLMFIPWLNVVNFFLWFWNSITFYKDYRTTARTLWILFSTALPLALLQIIVSQFQETIGLILGYINGYLIPLLLSYRFIHYQKQLNYQKKSSQSLKKS